MNVIIVSLWEKQLLLSDQNADEFCYQVCTFHHNLEILRLKLQKQTQNSPGYVEPARLDTTIEHSGEPLITDNFLHQTAPSFPKWSLR